MEQDAKNLFLGPSWSAILVFITVEPPNSYGWDFSPGSHSRSDSPFFEKIRSIIPVSPPTRASNRITISFQARGKVLFYKLVYDLIELVATIHLVWPWFRVEKNKSWSSSPFLHFISARFRFYFLLSCNYSCDHLVQLRKTTPRTS